MPTLYTGVQSFWAATPLMSAWAAPEWNAKKGMLNQGVVATNPTPTVASTLRSGFLQMSTNTASTTVTEIANVGHVFGRMG
jgi:hypothetical protein